MSEQPVPEEEPAEPPDDLDDPVGAEDQDDDEQVEEVPLLDPEMLPEVVTELATTSERHERRLGKLRTTVTALDDTVAEQSDALRELQETWAALEEALTEKVELTMPSRWAWGWLTQDEARTLWTETRWFVDQFVSRYPLSSDVSIPPCWYRHTVAVDELSDVYAAWREAYCGSSRPSTAMTAWRDRWLWPALTRLATHANWRECKENRHHIEPSARQDPTDKEFEEFVAADIAARPVQRSKQMPWPTKSPGHRQGRGPEPAPAT